MSLRPVPRREHRNISLLQLLPYMRQFPASAWVSLLHRASGILMFLMLPFIIWAFDASVSSEISFNKLKSVFNDGYGVMPGWMLKLVVLVVMWGYVYHLIAGIRFLMLDVNHHAAEKQRSGFSARVVLILSTVLTVVLGAKLFGLY